MTLEMVNTQFVEKALIGAILNDPDRRAEVPWLTAADFTNPLCRALWAHLETDNSPDGAPVLDLVALSQALGAPGGLHPTLRSPSALAELLLDAPLRPAIPDYGRVLVEMSTRRGDHRAGSSTRVESQGRTRDHPRRDRQHHRRRQAARPALARHPGRRRPARRAWQGHRRARSLTTGSWPRN